MKWSLTAGRIGGIPVHLHVTLLVFIPYLIFAVALQFRYFSQFLGVSPEAFALPPLAWGVILGFGVLAAILAHEWAHSAVAIAGGVPVHSITLMMLGGVSRISGDIVSPGREAWMAAAGPLASLVIGGASIGLQFLLPDTPADLQIAALVFGQINIVLAIFNLLPAFPMDGGRLLRAVLALRMSRLKATRIAAWVGRAMAVGFALLGVFVIQNPILVLIAVFVFLGAGAELAGLERKQSAKHLRFASLIDPNIGLVDGSVSAAELRDAFQRHRWSAALVRRGGDRPWRLLLPEDLVAGSGFDGESLDGTVQRGYQVTSVRGSLGEVLPYLREDPARVVVIVDDAGAPLGIISGKRTQSLPQLPGEPQRS